MLEPAIKGRVIGDRFMTSHVLFAATLLAGLAFSWNARAEMYFSAESVTGITQTGVASLNVYISSTSGIVYTATFDYGPTTGYGTNIPGTTGAWNVSAYLNGTISSVAISGLSCGTTYHWRVNVAAAGTGADQTFITSPCPAPAIGVSPSSQAYGSVSVDTSISQIVTISNTGTANLVVSSIGVTGGASGMFNVTTDTCASLAPTIAASGNCTIRVTFTPTSTGVQSTTLRIESNDSGSPTDVALSGTGAASSNSIPTLSEWGTIILLLMFIVFIAYSSRYGQIGKPA